MISLQKFFNGLVTYGTSILISLNEIHTLQTIQMMTTRISVGLFIQYSTVVAFDGLFFFFNVILQLFLFILSLEFQKFLLSGHFLLHVFGKIDLINMFKCFEGLVFRVGVLHQKVDLMGHFLNLIRQLLLFFSDGSKASLRRSGLDR